MKENEVSIQHIQVGRSSQYSGQYNRVGERVGEKGLSETIFATAVNRGLSRLVASSIATCLLLVALVAPVSAAAGDVVNVNSADVETLSLLPRVGPAVAQRIVDHREQNGTFKEKADLMLVRGIGERTFELLEPYVVLEGDSTLSEKVRVPRKQRSEAEGGESGSDGR